MSVGLSINTEAELKSALSAQDMHQNKCVNVCVWLSNTWVIDYVLGSVCAGVCEDTIESVLD